jgi:hypothetical protein
MAKFFPDRRGTPHFYANIYFNVKRGFSHRQRTQPYNKLLRCGACGVFMRRTRMLTTTIRRADLCKYRGPAIVLPIAPTIAIQLRMSFVVVRGNMNFMPSQPGMTHDFN